MNKHFLAAAAALLCAVSAQAAVSLGSPAATYSQSFDTLASSGTNPAWANNSTLPGWSLFNALGAAVPTYIVNNGSSTTGGFVSYGATGATERALGGLGSGGTYFGSPAAGAVAGYIALALSNDTGVELASFTLGFDGEQWRNGGNATPHTLVLEYGFGATFASVTGWAAPGAGFNFTSPIATTTAAAVDGNTAGLVGGLGGTVATAWAPGQTLWLRWTETNELGSDHGLAIDNLSVSVTAVPEPGTTGMLLAGLAAVALLARRRA